MPDIIVPHSLEAPRYFQPNSNDFVISRPTKLPAATESAWNEKAQQLNDSKLTQASGATQAKVALKVPTMIVTPQLTDTLIGDISTILHNENTLDEATQEEVSTQTTIFAASLTANDARAMVLDLFRKTLLKIYSGHIDVFMKTIKDEHQFAKFASQHQVAEAWAGFAGAMVGGLFTGAMVVLGLKMQGSSYAKQQRLLSERTSGQHLKTVQDLELKSAKSKQVYDEFKKQPFEDRVKAKMKSIDDRLAGVDTAEIGTLKTEVVDLKRDLRKQKDAWVKQEGDKLSREQSKLHMEERKFSNDVELATKKVASMRKPDDLHLDLLEGSGPKYKAASSYQEAVETQTTLQGQLERVRGDIRKLETPPTSFEPYHAVKEKLTNTEKRLEAFERLDRNKTVLHSKIQQEQGQPDLLNEERFRAREEIYQQVSEDLETIQHGSSYMKSPEKTMLQDQERQRSAKLKEAELRGNDRDNPLVKKFEKEQAKQALEDEETKKSTHNQEYEKLKTMSSLRNDIRDVVGWGEDKVLKRFKNVPANDSNYQKFKAEYQVDSELQSHDRRQNTFRNESIAAQRNFEIEKTRLDSALNQVQNSLQSANIVMSIQNMSNGISSPGALVAGFFRGDQQLQNNNETVSGKAADQINEASREALSVAHQILEQEKEAERGEADRLSAVAQHIV